MNKLHFDRNKFLLGTYCLDTYARTEQHIADLKAADIDFICSVDMDMALAELCKKYSMGIFPKYLPFWWGGKGEKAGQLHKEITVATYEDLAENFTDHPAIWGLDMGDEPSAADLPHYGKLFEAARRLFPHQMPYLNLYPSYGAIWSNTQEEIEQQLGVKHYPEHIDAFIRHCDADYICYDYYMYTVGISSAYENLRVVADRCRESERDMWIVLQVNSHDDSKWLNVDQLRHQAFTALAFGVKSINWACWTAGWFHNQVLDSEGNKTEQYEKLCIVNSEIRTLTGDYMNFRNKSTDLISSGDSLTLGSFGNIQTGGENLIGFMESADGDGIFIADTTDPYGEAPKSYEISFTCDRDIRAALVGAELKQEGDRYILRFHSNSAAFIR